MYGAILKKETAAILCKKEIEIIKKLKLLYMVTDCRIDMELTLEINYDGGGLDCADGVGTSSYG